VDRAVPFVVAAIVALAFQPIRTRLQRLANRLVYGRRATPYEVLTNLSRSMADISAGDELPDRMARALAEGTEADRAEVWLRVGDELRRAAAWPPGTGRPPSLHLNGALPAIPEAAESAPVRYQGEDLGVLAIVKREPITPIDSRLVNDLAHEAGLALKNVRLTAELVERLDELAASRQRLVKAQDAERRRLERDLHDGAQQHLVALKLKLGLAKRNGATDPKQLQALIDELLGETDEAIETLRELARGIYPPVLADSGLKAALEAHIRRSPVPVEIKAGPLQRYPAEMEAAVYFCCLEALQNAAKHAQADRVVITLDEKDGRLEFAVTDDGRGADLARVRKGSGIQNMADRLAALGGSLEVESTPNGGTTVSGRLPIRSRSEATTPA
jgi:signal transduction histidine kinase